MKIDLNKLVDRCNELNACKRLDMTNTGTIVIEFLSIETGEVLETADADQYGESK